MKPLKNLDIGDIHFGVYAKYVKRPLDFLISFLALIVLSPLLLIIGLLIRLFIGKPIFFKQIRCGRDEIPFEMIKFKTMRDLRDSDGHLLPDTERLSKFGSFLRMTSLDERPKRRYESYRAKTLIYILCSLLHRRRGIKACGSCGNYRISTD